MREGSMMMGGPAADAEATVLGPQPGAYQRLRRKLEFVRAYSWLQITGNTLGAKVNFLYAAQHAVSRVKSRGVAVTQEARANAKRLTTDGFLTLHGFDVDAMAESVDAYFATHKCDNGVGHMDTEAVARLAPHLYRALQGVTPTLNAYFGSHFQPYWAGVMRYESDGKYGADSSFGFHSDDNPAQILKVYFYLSDVTEETGAFRCFDYKTTRLLRHKGFISYTERDRVHAQRLVVSELEGGRLRVLEGKRGTCMIFDNNLVHKGTLPKKGIRDVVHLEVFPAATPFTEEQVRHSLATQRTWDYPRNPFVNDLAPPVH